MSGSETGMRSLALFVFLACTGQAAASDTSCPPVSAIKLSGTTDDGTNYQASYGGHVWKGEVSKYDHDVDLNKLAFHAAGVKLAKNLVVCDYEGDGSALRLSITKEGLELPRAKSWDVKGGNEAWCEAKDVASCPIEGI
ncbi:hypothetical protein [Luteibacter sp. CQ10]|uniref:hypothetical protein n=1 Tax=Luteibacter sp. CQ10 TaxID=2805821 RepID=UPI0034A556CD